MKSTVEQLTPDERKALVLFYDTKAYEAFKRLCELEIEGLGKDALGSTEHSQTRWFGGQANMAAKLPKLIRELHKESEANKEKQKKSQQKG